MSNNFIKRNTLSIVFFLCFIYWGYLFFAVHMDVSMDAISYRDSGAIIHEVGWEEFFKTGPHVEPLYPLLISWSMDIGKFFSTSYMNIQKLIQIFLLFLTQILTLRILNKLDVRPILMRLTILYIGFSPALVNATFSMFTEILGIPFSLIIILLNMWAWEVLPTSFYKKVFILGVISALLYTLAVFSKGIFLFMIIIFIGVHLIRVILTKIPHKRKLVVNTLVYIFVIISLVQGLVIGYKFLNKKYNGNFVYAPRFQRLFYGNAAKRAKPLTGTIFLSHLTYIPGEGVCRIFFSEKECEYCGLRTQDDIYGNILPPLLYDTPENQIESKIWSLSFEKVKERPGNYLLFSIIEACKTFFWESTQIGYVHYTGWLSQLYSFNPFKNMLRLVISLLSIWGFVYLFYYWRTRIKNREQLGVEEKQTLLLLSLILLFLVSFMAGYSVVTNLPRYTLPVAPLFLITIVFYFDRITRPKCG